MAKKTAWTPYGLEAIRIAHLRRRRLLGILLGLGVAVLWLSFFSTTVERDLQVTTDQGGNEISIDVSGAQQKPKDDKITVSIAPGRVTRAETGSGAAQDAPITRFAAPTFDRAAPIPWTYYLLQFGPFLLLALAVWLMRHRKTNEINYGIYKGALPLEMISAGAANHIFTTRHATSNIFGKRRVDFLPSEMVGVERVPQEEDA